MKFQWDFWLAQAQSGGQQPSIIPTLVMIVIMIGLFYVAVIMPNKRRQKEREEMLSKLKKGDRIITIGGIYGTITELKNESILLEIAPKTMIELARNSVREVIQDTSSKESKESKEKETSKPQG